MAIAKAIHDQKSPLSLQAVGMDTTEVPTDPPPENHQTEKSWVSMAQLKQVMKKYEFDISISEGKHSVEVPSEIIEKANPLWEDFVIAMFLETAPHIAKVYIIVNKIWAFGDNMQKLDVHGIRITNEKIREKVVRRGM